MIMGNNVSACCNVSVPLATRLEWSMSAFVSLVCLGIGISGLVGALSLGGTCLSCFYTSLVTLVLGTWVQIPSAVAPGSTLSKPRLMAMWAMAALVSVLGLIIGIVGLAGGFSVAGNNCFYPGLLTLVIGSWVKVPTPAKTREESPDLVSAGAGARVEAASESDEEEASSQT
jgi:hypothetical protein